MNIRKAFFAHYKDSVALYPSANIIGLFCQGSPNYGLVTENSDMDTKLIITPTFKELAMNKKPVSTTHIRDNNEHIDAKDIRLYIQTFRKQNLNFLEILYTPYFIVNPTYANEWNRLIRAREEITHMNPFRTIRSLKGMIMEKYHSMERPTPARMELIEKYGYDPKNLCNILRIKEVIEKYLAGESYKNCLIPQDCEYLIAVKNGIYDLEHAREVANNALLQTTEMMQNFLNSHSDEEKAEVVELLEDVQYEIMRISVERELRNEK